MPVIEITTYIDAPIDRCFDLARSIDLHTHSASPTGERAVAGVTCGLIGYGEEVTWRGKHFGIWQHLTSRITIYDPPYHFRDSMVRGAFKRIDHDHFFRTEGDRTVMIDRFDFDAPLGPLGHLANRIALIRHMRSFLEERNQVIKEVAESGGWGEFL
jgi:ligand-binding SRPBCC domain-containing protein